MMQTIENERGLLPVGFFAAQIALTDWVNKKARKNFSRTFLCNIESLVNGIAKTMVRWMTGLHDGK